MHVAQAKQLLWITSPTHSVSHSRSKVTSDAVRLSVGQQDENEGSKGKLYYVQHVNHTITLGVSAELDLYGLRFCIVVIKRYFQANLTIKMSYFWARSIKIVTLPPVASAQLWVSVLGVSVLRVYILGVSVLEVSRGGQFFHT